MNRIHISRNRQSLGQFWPNEVATGLRTGRFQPTDLAWQDPMESWKPLAEFKDLADVELGPPPLPEVPAAPVGPGEPSWEQRASLGSIRALGRTIAQVLSAPAATFRGMESTAPIQNALLYFLLLATVCSWVQQGYNLSIMLVFPDLLKVSMGDKVTTGFIVQTAAMNMVLTPFFLAGMAFVVSGVLHLLLTLLGLREPNFALTIRVFCYAAGTSYLLLLMPLCGPLFALVFMVIYGIVGLKEAHRTDAIRPLVAVVVPTLLLVFGYLLLAINLFKGGLK
jgi:hypothetical protein